jgi:PilZ domain
MDAPLVVIIAKSDHTSALRKRVGTDHAVAIFADAESLRAMEAIVTRPPKFVALDPTFVTTARGAALVAQVKADPRLSRIDVRVLAHDDDNVPLILAQPATSEAALLKTSLPLDRCGTRRTPRFATNGEVAAIINGERCEVIDLSVTGAQVVLPTRLRPDQPLRITLFDREVQVQCHGVVAWSIAEPTRGAVRYRAGVKFSESDGEMLEAFCARHAAPDSSVDQPA